MSGETVDAWEYEVTIKESRYVVVIGDDHFVRSVSRLYYIPEREMHGRQILWHKDSFDVPHGDASRAIQAARIVEREEDQAAIRQAQAAIADVIRGAIGRQPKDSTAERLANIVLIELAAAGYSIVRSEVPDGR